MVDNMAVAEVSSREFFPFVFKCQKLKDWLYFFIFLSVMVVAADASFFFYVNVP